MDRHERISVGGCCRIDAARQVGSEVFRRTDIRLASHDDGDAVVGLEFFFESQGYREGQVLFSQAVGDCARVGTSVPGVDGDDNAVGRVRGRRLRRCGRPSEVGLLRIGVLSHSQRASTVRRVRCPGCRCPRWMSATRPRPRSSGPYTRAWQRDDRVS